MDRNSEGLTLEGLKDLIEKKTVNLRPGSVRIEDGKVIFTVEDLGAMTIWAYVEGGFVYDTFYGMTDWSRFTPEEYADTLAGED